MPKGQAGRPPRENKKDAILDAATKIYAHYGFEGATLQRMAEELGVTRQLILKYYGSKEGLVRAITDRAVRRNLDHLANIDKNPGLTLRQRAEKQLEYMKPDREEWCLIVGTLLVPSFQFNMRGEIEGYFKSEYEAMLRHRQEFKTPTAEAVYAYAYADVSMRIGFIVSGRIEAYREALAAHQEAFLRPEHEIAAERSMACL